MDCLFCKIVDGQIPSEKIYEDEYVYAFYDIDKQAPIHFLVVPKKHITSIDQISEDDKALLADILLSIKNIAKQLNITNGYRIINNVGVDGAQSVGHMHFHVLAGRRLSWPPG